MEKSGTSNTRDSHPGGAESDSEGLLNSEQAELRAKHLLEEDAFRREHERVNTGLYLASVNIAQNPGIQSLQRLLLCFEEQIAVLQRYHKQAEEISMHMQLLSLLEAEKDNDELDIGYCFECEAALQQARINARQACARTGRNVLPLLRLDSMIKDADSMPF